MKSDHTEGGLLSNLELTGNRLLLDQTLDEIQLFLQYLYFFTLCKLKLRSVASFQTNETIKNQIVSYFLNVNRI